MNEKISEMIRLFDLSSRRKNNIELILFDEDLSKNFFPLPPESKMLLVKSTSFSMKDMIFLEYSIKSQKDSSLMYGFNKFSSPEPASAFISYCENNFTLLDTSKRI